MLFPQYSLCNVGATSPTKPITPINATETAETSEANATLTALTRSTEIPRLCAVSSPRLKALYFQLFERKYTTDEAVKIVIIKSSFQLLLAVSPKVQNTIAASCTSSAKYCRNMVPAVKREERVIPARIIVSVEPFRSLAIRRTVPEDSREKRNAASVVLYGERIFIASEALLCITPDPSIITENAAPKAAALETPSVKGMQGDS